MRITSCTILIVLTLAFSRASAADLPKNFDAEQSAVPHGKVEKLTYPSKTLGFDRPVVVYTPPGYSKDQKYPVLYLLHGSGDDETGWNIKGAANHILDNLYANPAAKMTPMIVVMPYGYAKKPGTPMPTDPAERGKISRAFDDDLINNLIPFIDAKYPTLADAQHRALAGLSMGGSQTLRGGLPNLKLFSYLGCFSSLLRDPFPEAIEKVLADADTTNSKLKLFYLSTGDKDKNVDGIKSFHELLDNRNIKHQWAVKSGTHEWKVWRESLFELAPLLFH
jgi:enterochelin esterase-like enzyme